MVAVSCCLVEGYSLQLTARSKHSSASTYEGEWMSGLLAVTGNTLCVTLSISVPKQFAVLAQLFSSVRARTVYEAQNSAGSHYAMDLYSTFPVGLTAADGDRVQLSIYVSLGVAIKTVDTSIGSAGQCSNNGSYLQIFSFRNSERLAEFCHA